MFMKIEFSDDTGDISEELDVAGEMEIEFNDDIGRVVMADTDINAEGKLLSDIGGSRHKWRNTVRM